MEEIIALITRHGSLVVLVVAFLEQIGAPVPAIPVMIVAAALAPADASSILQLLGLAVTGALLGDLIWYFLGSHYGYKVLAVLCRISLSPDSCVRKTETFFERWGLLSLTFAKFIPGYSTIAPPLAGASHRTSFLRFLMFDAAGAVLWAAISLLIGRTFGGAIGSVLATLESLGGWALVLVGSGLALFILIKWWERKRFYRTLRMARITPAELSGRLNDNAPTVILDVRSLSERERDRRRIPGALPLDPEQPEEVLQKIDAGSEIVLYCT
jgi:membrane protein DedA with SNARE-associated domain